MPQMTPYLEPVKQMSVSYCHVAWCTLFFRHHSNSCACMLHFAGTGASPATAKRVIAGRQADTYEAMNRKSW